MVNTNVIRCIFVLLNLIVQMGLISASSCDCGNAGATYGGSGFANSGTYGSAKGFAYNTGYPNALFYGTSCSSNCNTDCASSLGSSSPYLNDCISTCCTGCCVSNAGD
jgi:hypothetical protein